MPLPPYWIELRELVRPVQCGYIVYVYDAKIKLQLWNKGRILELLSGKDGQVRYPIVGLWTGVISQ